MTKIPFHILSGKFKMQTFHLQNLILPETSISFLKCYFIPTLVITKTTKDFDIDYVGMTR